MDGTGLRFAAAEAAIAGTACGSTSDSGPAADCTSRPAYGSDCAYWLVTALTFAATARHRLTRRAGQGHSHRVGLVAAVTGTSLAARIR